MLSPHPAFFFYFPLQVLMDRDSKFARSASKSLSAIKFPKKPDVSFLQKYISNNSNNNNSSSSMTSPAEMVSRIKQTIEATANHPNLELFRCIERAAFTTPRIQSHPIYPSLLEKRRKNKMNDNLVSSSWKLLELGCCFGTDARQMFLDGIVSSPAEELVVSDLLPGYWDIGRDILFQDKERVAGVSSFFLDLATPTLPDDILSTYSSHFDVVSAQAILHVLSKQQCHHFLRNIFTLLKSDKDGDGGGGGLVFGTCVGMKFQEGEVRMKSSLSSSSQSVSSSSIPSSSTACPPSLLQTPFLHTKDSLTSLLLELGYVDLCVKELDIPATSLTKDNPNVRINFSACRK